MSSLSEIFLADAWKRISADCDSTAAAHRNHRFLDLGHAEMPDLLELDMRHQRQLGGIDEDVQDIRSRRSQEVASASSC